MKAGDIHGSDVGSAERDRPVDDSEIEVNSEKAREGE